MLLGGVNGLNVVCCLLPLVGPFLPFPVWGAWGFILLGFVLGLDSGVGTAPDLGNHFLLRQKVIKNRFLIPTAELPARLWRSGQTAAVSQSFYGGRHFALLVPVLLRLGCVFVCLFARCLFWVVDGIGGIWDD